MNNSSVVFSDELAHAKCTIPHQNYTGVVVSIHIHSTVSPEHRCRNLFFFFFFLGGGGHKLPVGYCYYFARILGGGGGGGGEGHMPPVPPPPPVPTPMQTKHYLESVEIMDAAREHSLFPQIP